MLSREERIFGELLLARGLVARDFIEDFAKKRKSGGGSEPSLADVLIDSGGLGKGQAEEVLEEARAIDATLAPHLSGGTRLGEFRLIRELGRGGMGIVYEAEQESLGRRVALKVLPAGAALDERLAIRFLREARAAGRLQHPGIVPVFASGRAEGVLYFAMELVEGRSLAEVVSDGGPMAPEEAARVTAGIARALQHAHAAELVHRDVKPENILLAADGRARLTDFGLVHESVASSFTLPRHVLGTPAYMAPEQALGNAVDRRSDIYALGAVLYNLLCGKPPYGGDLPSVVLSRVLAGPPPRLLSMRDGIPPSLAAICERAMARKPDDRYATAAELAEDLETIQRGEELAVPIAPAQNRRVGWLLGALATVVAVVLLATLSMRGGSRAPDPVAARPDPKFVLVNATTGHKRSPSLSPDGKRLAYASCIGLNCDIWLEDLTNRESVKLAPYSFSLAFSPDGRSIAFHGNGGTHVLKLGAETVRDLGGPAAVSLDLAWSPDGREILVAGEASLPAGGTSVGRIWAVDVASRQARVVRSMDAQAPAYSPHGLRIAFVSRAGGPADVWTIPPAGGDAVRLTNDPSADWNPLWSADGRRVLFGSDRSGTPSLWSVGLDEASGRPTGDPEPVLRIAFPGTFLATLSADGRRVAIVGAPEPGRVIRLPFDPDSERLTSPPVALHRYPGSAISPQPSPDGRWLVYTALSPEQDLAVVAADGSSEPRFLTNDAFEDGAPRWSPDGERIAFHSNRSGRTEIWTIRPDGSDLRQVTKTTNGNAGFPVWSPDGTRIAYSVEGVGAYTIAVGADSAPEALPSPATGGSFRPSSWSPDGTSLAGSAAGVVLYSIRNKSYRRLTDVGKEPVWVGDGHRLLFANDRELVLIDRDGGNSRELYAAAPCGLTPSLGISHDGRSIYASLNSSDQEIWLAERPEGRSW